jgi:predicted DNA-binding transcriptional regulator YafY
MLRNKYNSFPSIEVIRSKCEDSLFGSDWGDHISISTIEKDFKAMRSDEELGFFAPIKYSRIEHGYYYTEEDYTIHNIPLKNEDIEAIKFASNTLMNFRESPMFAQFRFAIEKIFDRLNISSNVQDERLDKLVQFDSFPNHPGKEFLQPLYTAIKDYHQVELVYKRFNSNEESRRVVHPYLLKEYKHRWYLIGYVEEKESLSTYALDRMVDVKLKEEDFIIQSSFDPESFFKYSFGITQNDEKSFKVQLKFPSHQKGYLLTQPLHESQQILKESEKSFLLQLEVYITYELIERILGYGDNVTVIEPVVLKEKIAERLKLALANYYND